MEKSRESHKAKSPKVSHRERTRSGSGGRHGYHSHGQASGSVHADEKHPRSKYESVLEDLMTELIDEIALGLCFEVHRGCRMGTYMLEDLEDNSKQYEIVVQKGRDVFGVIPSKRTMPECFCPHCHRTLAASRFAPHLEKCMGMGRNSSRLASRRIANVGRVKALDTDESENDNENDQDWRSVASKKAKKMKREKSHHSGKRHHKSRSKHADDIPSVGSVASDASSNSSHAYETMTHDERKAVLSQTCGVISEHTRKMCQKSLKCPQHTDLQRKAVRDRLLGANNEPGESSVYDHIDIDSYSDNDSRSMRDVLQWQTVTNPSPSDSTSTLNSISSTHHRKSHSSSHSSKRSKGSSKSKSKKSSSGHKTSSSAKWPAGAPSAGSIGTTPGATKLDSSDSNASSLYNY